MEEPAVTVTQLAAQRERIRKKEADIKIKRAKIRAFQGLPPVRCYLVGRAYLPTPVH